MLDHECKCVEREFDDILVRSANELRERLGGLRQGVRTTEEGLQATFARLPDRERLALKCMLARDVFHMAKLYEAFLRTSPAVANAIGAAKAAPPEIDRSGETQSVLVFQQSLFD